MAVARSSLPEQVFRQLVAAVLDGRYAPGERLPTQRALAADLGVNMASLREGIKRLEQLRLVDVKHGDAMRVQDWRAHAGSMSLRYAVTVDPALTGALFEARRLLLCESARLAAERRGRTHERTLLDLAEAFEAAEDDAAAQLIDLAFMATVIDAAGNLVFTVDPQLDPRAVSRPPRALPRRSSPAARSWRRCIAAPHARSSRGRAGAPRRPWSGWRLRRSSAMVDASEETAT